MTVQAINKLKEIGEKPELLIDYLEHGLAFFLHTSLNGPETSALFCAMIDAGLIVNQSYTSLFLFMAPELATRRKKGLNASSLSKSKDKLNPEMKRRVKDLLMEMSRIIEKY